jgi:hypothetical protein
MLLRLDCASAALLRQVSRSELLGIVEICPNLLTLHNHSLNSSSVRLLTGTDSGPRMPPSDYGIDGQPRTRRTSYTFYPVPTSYIPTFGLHEKITDYLRYTYLSVLHATSVA